MNDAFAMMQEDVEQLVRVQKKTLLHEIDTKWDSTRRVGRYLDRNKAKMAGGAVKLLAAGLLTGPVGLGIAVGTTVASTLAIQAWRGIRKHSARGQVATHGSGPMDLVNGVDESWEEIVEAVGYLCRHEQMTNLINAFIDLEEDNKALNLLIATTPSDYSDCTAAWKFLEHVERVRLRFNALDEPIKLIDDLVIFIVADLSRMDSAYKSHARSVVNHVMVEAKVSGKAALDILNEAANSSAVFNHFFSKNYHAWIKVQVAMAFDLSKSPIEVAIDSAQKTTSGTAASTLVSEIAKSISGEGGSVAFTAATASKDKVVEAIGKSYTDMSVGVGSQTLASGVAGGINTGIGIVVDVAVESLVQYLDIKALKKIQARLDELRATGVREWQVMNSLGADDIEVLRKNAKKVNEKLVEKMLHLRTAHAEFITAAGGQDVPAKARAWLRRQKLRAQVDQLFLVFGMFHQFTVGRARHAFDNSRNALVLRGPAIYGWLESHTTLGQTKYQPCDGLCCYLSGEDYVTELLEDESADYPKHKKTETIMKFTDSVFAPAPGIMRKAVKPVLDRGAMQK